MICLETLLGQIQYEEGYLGYTVFYLRLGGDICQGGLLEYYRTNPINYRSFC